MRSRLRALATFTCAALLACTALARAEDQPAAASAAATDSAKPAPAKAVAKTAAKPATVDAAVKSIDAGLAIEASYFTKLLIGKQAPVMIRSLFLSPQELNKGARRPRGEPDHRIKRLGIVGAGFMGAGIAYAAAKAGIAVVVIDRDLASAEKGKAHSATVLDKQIARGEASEADKHVLLSRITPSVSYSDLSGCDLVIEAVFENRDIKADVWAEIDAALPPEAIRARGLTGSPGFGEMRNSARPSHWLVDG